MQTHLLRTSLLTLLALLTVLTALGGCQTANPPLRSQRVYTAPPLANGQEHPHLYLRKDDIERIRSRVADQPELAAWWEKYVADTRADRPIEFPPEDGRIQPHWASTMGRMGGYAARCATIYQVTGSEGHAQWVRQWLLACTRQFDRVNFQNMTDYLMPPEPGGQQLEGGNTMGYFFVGRLLCDAAFAYDCVYDMLSEAERQEIRDGFFYRFVSLIEAYDHSRRQNGAAPDFMHAGGQWNGANLCNMGLAAVGFLFDDARLYERAVDNWRLYMARDLLEDGFWIEEDLGYANICLDTLFNIAWMARSSGYHEDLFMAPVHQADRATLDERYHQVLASSDGPPQPLRRLDMYLDAQIRYQLPNFAAGNWGWTPGRGALANDRHLIAMFRTGHAIYGRNEYAYVLKRVGNRPVGLAPGSADLPLTWSDVAAAEPPPVASHWYPHGRWIILRSVEGPQYWDSDSFYAFMPYGGQRTKGLLPLSLDLFAYGRSLAPQITLRGYAQNLTKSYQLTEPAWNTVMINGCRLDTFRDRIVGQGVNYVDLRGDIKVFSSWLHLNGQRRYHLYSEDVERHAEEDRVMSRTLLMTDRYLVDVFAIRYDRPSLYKRNFDYILHGYGELALEPWPGNASQEDVTATWTQEDGVGLRTTVLSAGERGSMKISKFSDTHTQFMRISRADFDERFIAIHEPFKGPSRAVRRIECLHDSVDGVALRITLEDGSEDLIWLRLAAGGRLPDEYLAAAPAEPSGASVSAETGRLFPPEAAQAKDYFYNRRPGGSR